MAATVRASVLSAASREHLVQLGEALRREKYAFVTPTPATHARVVARRAANGTARAEDLRDVFGWNLPFEGDRALSPAIKRLLLASGEVISEGDVYKSRVRFSTIERSSEARAGGEEQASLFVHDGYPTSSEDAVFFGPDTYRFVRLLESLHLEGKCAVDVGCGSGAGGIRIAPAFERVILGDVNPRALALARVNLALEGRRGAPGRVRIQESDLLAGVQETPDLVIANPPYMRDDLGRTYRDGGGVSGEGLSLKIVDEAFLRLAPRGTLVLYTASAIEDGRDRLRHHLLERAAHSGMTATYEEIDPDVFGEELEQPAYRKVERLAVVAFVARRSG